MQKIDDYVLCTKASQIEFNTQIKDLLSEGYQPLGQPFSTIDIELPYYCQAMVRYQEERR